MSLIFVCLHFEALFLRKAVTFPFLALVCVTCPIGPGSLTAPGRPRLARVPLPRGRWVTCWQEVILLLLFTALCVLRCWRLVPLRIACHRTFPFFLLRLHAQVSSLPVHRMKLWGFPGRSRRIDPQPPVFWGILSRSLRTFLGPMVVFIRLRPSGYTSTSRRMSLWVRRLVQMDLSVALWALRCHPRPLPRSRETGRPRSRGMGHS